jgi:pimeloyl-ACP methyl ester carboxylesterase
MIKKAYVDTPSGQIHYRYGGPVDATPIIFLHQNVSSSKMYERTLAALEDRFRVYAFDLPGFGESYDPPPFTSISELTLRVMEAVDELGLAEFHAFGNHTGAGMVAEMAMLYPERVKSVMMVGPLRLTNEEKQWYRENFSGSAAPDVAGTYLAETWDYLTGLGATRDMDMCNDEMWLALRAWRARGMVYRCVWDYPFDEFISHLQCPVLLLSAPDDVLYLGYQRTKEAMPEAMAIELTGANFEPNLDPQGTSAAVRRFMDGIGA